MLHLLPLELQHYILFDYCWALDWAAVFAVWPYLRVHIECGTEAEWNKDGYGHEQCCLVKRNGQFIQTKHVMTGDTFFFGLIIQQTRETSVEHPAKYYKKYDDYFEWKYKRIEVYLNDGQDLYTIDIWKGDFYKEEEIHITIQVCNSCTMAKNRLRYRRNPRLFEWYDITKKKANQEWNDTEVIPDFLLFKPFVARLISLFLQKSPPCLQNLLHLD